MKKLVDNEICVREQGLSLIELLVALGLSSMLLISITSIYLGVKTLYGEHQELARKQENLRFLHSQFADVIATAGFCGCRKLSEVKLINHSSIKFDYTHSIRGYTAGKLPDYWRKIANDYSDVLILQKADAGLTKVISNVLAKSSQIKVEHHPAHQQNRLLLVADCRNAEIFFAKNYSGNTIYSTTNFRNSFQEGVTEVGRVEEIAFFIGDTGRLNAQGKPIFALFKMVNGGNKEELIPEIKSMQLEFGVMDAKNKSIEKYYKANEINSLQLWKRVGSVRAFFDAIEIYVKLKER